MGSIFAETAGSTGQDRHSGCRFQSMGMGGGGFGLRASLIIVTR